MSERPRPAAVNESHRDMGYGMPLDTPPAEPVDQPAANLPVPEYKKTAVGIMGSESGPVPSVRCNWDLSTLAGKALAVRAMNPATMDIAALGAVRIRATHWCTFPDSSVDEDTGEESTFTRTVLLGKNGQSVRTTSEHIARKIESIFSLFSPEEQAQGIPLLIAVRPSRRPGHHYHAIEIYNPEIEEEG